jgi:hypothetical protein
MMEIRSVPAGRGWSWITQAFALFGKAFLPWLVINTLLVAVGWLLGKVPGAGEYIFYLLAPIFLAGILAACRDLDAGGSVAVEDLFRGFRQNTTALVVLGVFHMGSLLAIEGLIRSIAGPEFQEVMRGTLPMTDPSMQSPEVQSRILLAMLAALSLYLPMAMALWFSPALVMLDNQPPLRALATSLRASLRNLAPFLVFGLASSALFLLALIPYGLGLVLWAPVMALAIYTSYRDVLRPAPPG